MSETSARPSSSDKPDKSAESFFPIRINSVHPLHAVTFEIFVKIGERHVRYLHAGDFLTEEKIKKLDSHGQFFYVQEKNRQDYKNYVHGEINSDKLDSKQKAEILRESSYTLVSELFENPDVHQALDEAKEVVFNMVDFMEADPEGMAHLISLSSHDFYTYNHSLDVSIYSLGLGQTLGYSTVEITELGQGSLYHDIGKRHVSADIICKAGPLDDIEWAQMQKHPQFGLQILNDHENVSEAIKACCFEHHESFLGNGYPQQLDGDEIHPFARIVALTDTYDALTTKRSYNNPMTPKQALEFMREKISAKYDPEMLRAFHSSLFKISN